MEYKELSKQCYETVVSKGFYEKWNKARKLLSESDEPDLAGVVTLAELALVTTEVSEACEEVRNMDKEKMAKELAGLQIRIFSLSENQNIDLEKYILLEDERNKARPVLHGRKMI